MKNTLFKIIMLLPLIVFSQAIDPIYITLNGDITSPDQEISGLAWYNGNLILLPQYPKDVVYSIPKTQIIEFIDSSRTTILPNEIGWNSSDIERRIRGFEGYESIIFNDDTIYVTIVERGMIGNNKNENIINYKSVKKIKTTVTIRNMA